MALVAAGCGGGGEEAAADPAAASPTPGATPTDPAGTGVAAPGGTAAPGTGGATGSVDANGEEPASETDPLKNEITNADAKVGAEVTVSAITPKKFSNAHCAKPIVVVLYQPGAIVDQQLLKEAKAAANYKDTVLLTYAPTDVKEFGDLPSKLGLLSTPGVAVVTRSGQIGNFWTTYVDRALISRSVKIASATKACKVVTADVPAAGSAIGDAAALVAGGQVTTATAPATLAGAPPGTPAVEAAAATPIAGAATSVPGTTAAAPATGTPAAG